MRINRDAVKSVASAVADAALSATSPYNYDNLLDSLNLRHDCDKVRASSIMICCPFHSDEDPSLSIDYDRQTWYCYGCGKSGDVLQFLVEYDNCILGAETNRAKKANEIVHTDPSIRASAGVATVYQKERVTEDFQPAGFKRFRYRAQKPKTFLELASAMTKCSNAQKEEAILLMQAGLGVDKVYESIFEEKKVYEKKEYDLSSLWEE